MDKRIPQLPLGLAVTLVLVAAVVLSASANATQPECKAINQTQDVAHNSNAYADPLGTTITEANPGDTIKVIGTCYGNFQILTDLTLTGRPSEQQEDTLDGGGTGTVLYIGAYATVEISNLRITNGSGGSGGGINNTGRLTLTDTLVSDNSAASYGGGIFTTGFDLTLNHTTVSGNTAWNGAGIYSLFRTNTITLNNSTIVGNTANNTGGGVYNSLGTLVISDSTLADNVGAIWGGGIVNLHDLTLTNSTVAGNEADYGGGIYTRFGTAEITSSTITNNAATYGGGIYNGSSYGGGTLVVTNSTVTGNQATSSGGGIYNNTGTVTLDSGSSIDNNTATSSGGGIINYSGTLNNAVAPSTLCPADTSTYNVYCNTPNNIAP